MTNLIDLGGALIGAPKPGAHTYGRRLKRAFIPMTSIAALMSLRGDKTYRMEGWPEGAKIVGAEVSTQPFALKVMIYHPDFPVVPLSEYPGLIKVTCRLVS